MFLKAAKNTRMEQLKSNYNTTLWVLFEILNFLPGTNAHDNVAVTIRVSLENHHQRPLKGHNMHH